jgi:signal transduction histidine kinase
MAFGPWDRDEAGRYGRISLAVVALAFGVLTLSRARHDPGGSFAGASTLGATAEVAAGWGLVGFGLVFWERHRGNRCGPLIVAAGFAWFLPEWTNPGIGSAVGFTVGLIGIAACVPLVGHAALAYPSGHLRSLLERLTIGVAYAGGVVLLGLLPTAVYDPHAIANSCNQCSPNLALVGGSSSLNDAFERYGLRIGMGWLAALALLTLWRLVRGSRVGVLVVAPVALPAAAYLGLVAWDFQHSLRREFIGTDGFDVRTWRYESLALVLLAFGVGLGLSRERRARGAVAKLVVELGRSPRPGALRDALAEALDDPNLAVAYRRAGGDGYVNAAGMAVDTTAGRGQMVTPLLREQTQVGVLIHDARLGDQPGLVEEVVSAARLALQNEQLKAEVRAQLDDLRASRMRIVEAADAERRRLERDLHDGAQQRIVGLSLALQLLRTQLDPEAAPDQAARITAAQEKLQQSLAELRELAHGIYPAVLSDEGLSAAIEVLAEQADIPIRLEALAEGRFPATVENAAYFVIAEAIDGSEQASVRVEQDGDRLVIHVRSDTDDGRPDRTEIADRVGSLDGRLTARDGELRAEIPCGS